MQLQAEVDINLLKEVIMENAAVLINGIFLEEYDRSELPMVWRGFSPIPCFNCGSADIEEEVFKVLPGLDTISDYLELERVVREVHGFEGFEIICREEDVLVMAARCKVCRSGIFIWDL